MGRAEDSISSPLATVDDIHRRLLRPPFLNIPSCYRDDDHGDRSSFRSQAIYTPIQRKQETKHRETMKRKLEDYLDPVLLSVISSNISGRVKKNPQTRTKSKREIKDFEWPVDELEVFMEDSRPEKKGNKAVNLNDDLDLIADGENTKREDEFCTPFGRYEETALKRFKR